MSFLGSNRVSALAEELFAGGSSTGLCNSRSKADCTDDSSARSSETTTAARKKSSIGKTNKTPKKLAKKSREMTYLDTANIINTKRCTRLRRN